jgi:hypothetical protein
MRVLHPASWILALLLVAACLPAAEASPARDVLTADAPPWYDAEQDTWKRIEARGVEMPELPDFKLSGWKWGFSGFSAGIVAWILIAALAIALAILLLRLWPRRQTADAHRVRRIAGGAIAWTGLGDEGELDPESGLANAVAAGDWRRAVAWAYVRILIRLDGAGVLHLQPGDTAHGVLHAVAIWATADRRRASAPRALGEATTTFEMVCWAHQPASRAQLDRILAADQRLIAILALELETA